MQACLQDPQGTDGNNEGKNRYVEYMDNEENEFLELKGVFVHAEELPNFDPLRPSRDPRKRRPVSEPSTERTISQRVEEHRVFRNRAAATPAAGVSAGVTPPLARGSSGAAAAPIIDSIGGGGSPVPTHNTSQFRPMNAVVCDAIYYV